MRRVLMAVAVVVTLIATSATAAQARTDQVSVNTNSTTSTTGTASTTVNRSAECRYQFLDGRAGFNVTEVKKTIYCVTHKYRVDYSLAMVIADHESHYNQFATNSSSGACGIFQHLPSYFPGRLSSASQAWPKQRKFIWSCYNARSNIYAAVHLARVDGGWYAAWCQWASYC